VTGRALGGRSPRFLLGALAGAALFLVLWEWAARGQSPAVMPSPARTFEALGGLITDGTLLPELGLTVGRAFVATLCAAVVGVLFGWAAARFDFADGLLAPLRAVLQGLPPIVLIVCLVLWMGSDPAITVIVCTTVMVPLVAAATTSALRGMDPHLLELAAGLHLSRTRRTVFVVVPAVLPAILAATGAVASASLRVVVMAELLSAPDGIGAAIAQNRTLLQTPELYAWTLVLVGCALAVDVLVRAVVSRWSAVFTPSSRAAGGRPTRVAGGRPARGAGGRPARTVSSRTRAGTRSR
jgi:NitT/TauT family transport system permease protein